MFYVIIGGAALLSAGVIPLAIMIGYRYYRRYSSRRPQLHPGGTPRLWGKQQSEKPKLFDVYIKPGLEVDETRFEDLLPIAVRVTDTNLGEKQLAQPDRSSRSKHRGEAASETYDVAVLIAMPTDQPRIMDRWDELGEYTLGTLKLPAVNILDDP